MTRPVNSTAARPVPGHVRVLRGVPWLGTALGTLLSSVAPGMPQAVAATPADYASNLALIRGSAPRNANHDDSPWRDVPQQGLVREDFLGPRSEYVGPSATSNIVQGGQEWANPAPTTGQFRITCEFSHFAYDDPIVHPGEPGASHLHMFWGNTDVNAYSTYETLIDSGSSTCNGQEINRTGYWAPAMIDAAGNARMPSRIIVYYKGYGAAQGASVVYPPGSAIIAMPNLHTVPASRGGVEFEQTFQCSDIFRGPRFPQGNTIPTCTGGVNPVQTLEMHVKFPNCLGNGDPADPASWVTSFSGDWYASDCGGWTTTPNIEYIIQYPLGDGETTEGWYLASDVDPDTRRRNVAAGASSHADWWGGWQAAMNQEWLDGCTNRPDGGEPAGCGMGYLTNGGPDRRNPLSGPALKLRPDFDTGTTEWGLLTDPSAGDYKVPVASLHEQLCPGGERIDTAEAAAHCRPNGGMTAGMTAGMDGGMDGGTDDGIEGPPAPVEPDAPTEPEPPVSSAGDGLRGRYFDDVAYAEFTGERIDPTLAFDFDEATLAGTGVTSTEGFAVEWQGFLTPDRTETVTLYTRADDGVRLFIDGELLIDNRGTGAATIDTVDVQLEAGRPVAIGVYYFQDEGAATLELGWERPGRGSEVIGSEYLYSAYPG